MITGGPTQGLRFLDLRLTAALGGDQSIGFPERGLNVGAARVVGALSFRCLRGFPQTRFSSH